MSDEIPLRPEFQLLKDITALDLSIVDQKTSVFHDNISVKMVLRDDPEVLSSCAFSLIYALGVLSFDDARPRGVSGMDFTDDDQWGVGDMLQHLRFENGHLRLDADYVRGRMMKTRIDIDEDGVILLETVNRGECAPRWVATLQGKKRLAVVEAAPEPSGA